MNEVDKDEHEWLLGSCSHGNEFPLAVLTLRAACTCLIGLLLYYLTTGKHVLLNVSSFQCIFTSVLEITLCFLLQNTVGQKMKITRMAKEGNCVCAAGRFN